MKKIFVYFLLFGFALPLWACQPSSPSPQDVIKQSASQERRLGQLQSLGGAHTSTQATHLLRMEDGKNLYLKSPKIDLNSEKYLSKEIEVMGEIVRTKDGYQIMTVVSIDVLDQISKQDNDLPQWVDYDSSALQLSFKYRDDYAVNESSEIITVKRIKKAVDLSENIEINTINKPESEMLIELLTQAPDKIGELMGVNSLESADVLAGGFTKSKITQKALNAYKKVNSLDKSTEYYLQNSKGVYRLSFKFVEEDEEKNSFQNMFYDILASIDFKGDEIAETDVTTMPLEVDSSPLSAENVVEKDVLDEEYDQDKAINDNEDSIVIDTNSDITGFTLFQSESAGFSVQYPKSYYFGSLENKPKDSLRSYEFGSEPLEESSGEIILDVINAEIPNGTKLSVNGRSITKVNSGSDVVLYTEVDGKIYRITGQSGKEAIMKQMISTVQ